MSSVLELLLVIAVGGRLYRVGLRKSRMGIVCKEGNCL